MFNISKKVHSLVAIQKLWFSVSCFCVCVCVYFIVIEAQRSEAILDNVVSLALHV